LTFTAENRFNLQLSLLVRAEEMKKLPGVLLLSIALTASACAAETSQPAEPAASSPPTASYLMAGAPTFDMTIAQFREKFNASYVDTPLLEFRAIDSGAAL
jgi:Protein of unknown function (DUF1454).